MLPASSNKSKRKPKVVFVRVADLVPCKVSRSIYGDGPSPDHEASVKKHGVLQPILALVDGTIISGETRWASAKANGLRVVPVIYLTEIAPGDNAAIAEAVITCNIQRVKTPAQIASEVEYLTPIVSAGAAERMKSGGNPPLMSAEGQKGETNVLIGKKIGLGSDTVRKYRAVEKQIKAYEAKGWSDEAAELKYKRDNESVNAAFNEIKRQQPQPAPSDPLTEAIGRIEWCLRYGISGLGEAGLVAGRVLNQPSLSKDFNQLVRPMFALLQKTKRALAAAQSRKEAG